MLSVFYGLTKPARAWLEEKAEKNSNGEFRVSSSYSPPVLTVSDNTDDIASLPVLRVYSLKNGETVKEVLQVITFNGVDVEIYLCLSYYGNLLFPWSVSVIN